MMPPRDDAPGHERRTVFTVLGTIVIAGLLVVIALMAHGYF